MLRITKKMGLEAFSFARNKFSEKPLNLKAIKVNPSSKIFKNIFKTSSKVLKFKKNSVRPNLLKKKECHQLHSAVAHDTSVLNSASFSTLTSASLPQEKNILLNHLTE